MVDVDSAEIGKMTTSTSPLRRRQSVPSRISKAEKPGFHPIACAWLERCLVGSAAIRRLPSTARKKDTSTTMCSSTRFRGDDRRRRVDSGSPGPAAKGPRRFGRKGMRVLNTQGLAPGLGIAASPPGKSAPSARRRRRLSIEYPGVGDGPAAGASVKFSCSTTKAMPRLDLKQLFQGALRGQQSRKRLDASRHFAHHNRLWNSRGPHRESRAAPKIREAGLERPFICDVVGTPDQPTMPRIPPCRNRRL